MMIMNKQLKSKPVIDYYVHVSYQSKQPLIYLIKRFKRAVRRQVKLIQANKILNTNRKVSKIAEIHMKVMPSRDSI